MSDPSPNVRQAVPFLGVDNMTASRAFYVYGLGFTMTASWRPEESKKVRWCLLQLGGASLMLQEFWTDGAHGGRPNGPLGQGVSICFMCEDALAIYRDALENGLKPSRPFVGNGLWVVSFTDPDGYRIDFESPTTVPEETEYDPALHD